jgi:hypothetical protein
MAMRMVQDDPDERPSAHQVLIDLEEMGLSQN